MVIVEKRSFAIGAIMAIGFLAVLAVMFSPLFGGENAFHASDRLFNSIAKGSSYAIPRLIEQNKAHGSTPIEMALDLKEERTAAAAVALLARAGAEATAAGAKLSVRGDLGDILAAVLADSDAMFWDRGSEVRERYGMPEREALYAWWAVLKEMYREAQLAKRVEEAKRLEEVKNRAVEVGYNFYGISPAKASEHVGILTFALLFYVVYTMWWGYAILYLFDGFGLQMKPSHKKEA
jgi:hypothetical protein